MGTSCSLTRARMQSISSPSAPRARRRSSRMRSGASCIAVTLAIASAASSAATTAMPLSASIRAMVPRTPPSLPTSTTRAIFRTSAPQREGHGPARAAEKCVRWRTERRSRPSRVIWPPEVTLKVAILGSGAVGGYFGARLADAGEDVAFIARGRQLAAMREAGLDVRSPRGDLHLQPVRATDDPASIGPVDVVLFTVKLWSTEEAARQLPPLVGRDTAVISLQ